MDKKEAYRIVMEDILQRIPVASGRYNPKKYTDEQIGGIIGVMGFIVQEATNVDNAIAFTNMFSINHMISKEIGEKIHG